MPECQAWPEVRIAANAAEFSAALDVARAAGQDPAVRQRLRETARQNSWLQRVQAVEERLCGADKVAAQPRAGGTPP
jgi:F0F1-type ATP synthase epsilon subunit